MAFSLATKALAALFIGQALAHPLISTGQHDHRVRSLQRRQVDISKFQLTTSTNYINAESGDSALKGFRSVSISNDYVKTAKDFVAKTFKDAEFRVADDSYVGVNGVAHVYFKQTAHGLDIDNADLNVNISRDGTVFSYGDSVFKGEIPPPQKREFSDPIPALKAVSDVLELGISAERASVEATEAHEEYKITRTTGADSDPIATLVYFQKPDGTLGLSWRVQTDVITNYLMTYTDAFSPESILGAMNYVADAIYEVYKWGVHDPSAGVRTLETDPWDTTASPNGWHSSKGTNYDTTMGNNGYAQEDWDADNDYASGYRPHSADLKFDYPYYGNETNPHDYINATVTQLFYTANMYHDLLYLLGFNEAAGNFEDDNGSKGGKGGDPVILDAQDGLGTNNDNFRTLPDGQKSRMQMYLFDVTTPNRDGALSADVVIHEYTHGVSNRLTGGPANVGCLNTVQAGGMGEGWGDFMGAAILTKADATRDTDFIEGAWVINDPKGIRDYPYSTIMTRNPHTYADIKGVTEVHDIGETWATMLYEVLWNLIDKHGNTADARPTFGEGGVPVDGRFLAMKLVVDAMALQPCSPTFVQARDAVVDADVALTGGANRCEIWRAFAKRGLGKSASGTKVADKFDLPEGC
ncbi:extracellular elastinolytic metallo proteinase [Mytilinidion resinicola]|uniref:Extracellular metalloproteinase n=1 Tax=Mytilinidion resinicola TaxID=574789 RepID=A0A6A6Y6D3_9PEZI|nr:extracellular elastinolytic metallo proteinase [Mytilinidion resinicola]KAF2803574.1 extracellular elastinolytic metallo proteinase [Mytilinidion resinicola]